MDVFVIADDRTVGEGHLGGDFELAGGRIRVRGGQAGARRTVAEGPDHGRRAAGAAGAVVVEGEGHRRAGGGGRRGDTDLELVLPLVLLLRFVYRGVAGAVVDAGG